MTPGCWFSDGFREVTVSGGGRGSGNKSKGYTQSNKSKGYISRTHTANS